MWLPKDLLSSICVKRIRDWRQSQPTATQDFPGKELSRDVVTAAPPILLSLKGRKGQRHPAEGQDLMLALKITHFVAA